MSLPLRLVCLAVIILAIACEFTSADRGCPDNQAECAQSCKAEGKQFGACERRWYGWRLQWRCKCNPCQGVLVAGVCSSEPEAQLAAKLAASYVTG